MKIKIETTLQKSAGIYTLQKFKGEEEECPYEFRRRKHEFFSILQDLCRDFEIVLNNNKGIGIKGIQIAKVHKLTMFIYYILSYR